MAGVGTVAGHPVYNSAGTANYIPQLFAAGTRVKYYSNTTLTAIANTKYEGQISDEGDKVIIRTRPSVVINRYYKGKKLEYQNLESPSIELNIDHAYDYAFKVDKIDKKQADVVLSDEFQEDASQQMMIKVDTDVYADIYSDADSANQGSTAGKKSAMFDLGAAGSPLALSKTNVLDWLINMKTVLTEQDVPDDKKRWIVLPAWITGLIDKSDLQDASFSGKDESRVYKNGYIGSLAGFNIHESNLLSTTTDSSTGNPLCTNVIFGHKDALTFAAQLVDNDSLKLQDTFGMAYRGLYVCGYKVVVPEAFGWAYVTPDTA